MSVQKTEEYDKIVAELKIVGMHCSACAVTIEKALKKVEGVLDASVSYAGEEAKIVLKPGKVKLEDIVKAIREVGYDVERKEATFKVEGLETYSDEKTIEDALSRMLGILTVRAASATSSVFVEYNDQQIDTKRIEETLKSLGYKVLEVSDTGLTGLKMKSEEEEKKLLNRSLVGFAFTIPILLLVYGIINPAIIFPNEQIYRFAILALATPVQFYTGWRFLSGGLRALKNGVLNMDVLVMLGTMTAYIYSLFATLDPGIGHIYFEASAVVITFVTFGRYLESRAKGRASDAIKKLMELQPRKARILDNGEEKEVPISAIAIKDKVVVKPGERIPVDGVVVDGSGYVDESIITGESVPVKKEYNSPVVAGTLLTNGYLVISTTRVGKDTTVNQIATLVKLAQLSKPKIQRTVDKIVSMFVPIVVSVALASFFYWFLIANTGFETALIYAVAVLVVACPCALGLATPLAIMVGYDKGAESGIVIKNGEAFERVTEVEVIVFDKTGTLTIGEPSVTNIVPTNGHSEEDVLKIAALVESKSEHPIAQAIVKEAKQKGVYSPDTQLDRFDYFPGQGVIALINNEIIAVGNEDLMERGIGVKLSEKIRERAGEMRNEAKTVVFVSKGKQIIGLIAVADRIKPHAEKVIEKLKEMGLKVHMLTGDNRRTAEAIAKQLGIDEYRAEAKPNDKINYIKELQRQGKKVMMIGDGVNDAPSLSQADVGVAMGGGTDIAAEAGDIILMRDDLRGIVALFELSKKIKNKIKQNLAWAFIYNIILIPVAAGVFTFLGLTLKPELAGIAMAFSSISVTASSLTLKMWKPKAYTEL